MTGEHPRNRQGSPRCLTVAAPGSTVSGGNAPTIDLPARSGPRDGLDGGFGSTRPQRRFVAGPIRAAGPGTPRRPGPAARSSRPPFLTPADGILTPMTRSPRTRPTLEEVAARAGVGRGTASRVINGGEKVSARARHAVEEAIAELGYVP